MGAAGPSPNRTAHPEFHFAPAAELGLLGPAAALGCHPRASQGAGLRLPRLRPEPGSRRSAARTGTAAGANPDARQAAVRADAPIPGPVHAEDGGAQRAVPEPQASSVTSETWLCIGISPWNKIRAQLWTEVFSAGDPGAEARRQGAGPECRGGPALRAAGPAPPAPPSLPPAPPLLPHLPCRRPRPPCLWPRPAPPAPLTLPSGCRPRPLCRRPLPLALAPPSLPTCSYPHMPRPHTCPSPYTFLSPPPCWCEPPAWPRSPASSGLHSGCSREVHPQAFTERITCA